MCFQETMHDQASRSIRTVHDLNHVVRVEGGFQAYAKGRLELHVHFRLWKAGGQPIPGDFCLRYNVDPDWHWSDQLSTIEPSDSQTLEEVHKPGRGVLIMDVQDAIKNPEVADFPHVPSVVRLGCLHDCHCRLVEKTGELRRQYIRENRALLGDWEPEGFDKPIVCALLERKDYDSIVQAGTKLSGQIDQDEQDRLGGNLLDEGTQHILRASLRIWFGRHTHGYEMDKASGLVLEPLQMMFCPA